MVYNKLTKDLLSGAVKLYSQKEYTDILSEDFGNLNWISPKFKATLGEIMRSTSVGQNSEFNTVVFKNATQILTLNKNDSGIVAIVGKVGNDQLFISQIGAKYPIMRWDYDLIKKYTDKSTADLWGGPKDLKTLLLALKKTAPNFEVVAIQKDTNRTALMNKRAQAKAGAVALLSPDQVRKQFASELRSKLSAFKLDKVKSTLTGYSDPKAAVAAFSKDIPKSLNINGNIYQLYSDYNTGIGSLLDPDNKWNRESYLEYKLAPEDEEKMWDWRMEERKRLKALDLPDEEIWQRTRVVKRLKAFIALQGLSIVVKDIKAEEF